MNLKVIDYCIGTCVSTLDDTETNMANNYDLIRKVLAIITIALLWTSAYFSRYNNQCNNIYSIITDIIIIMIIIIIIITIIIIKITIIIITSGLVQRQKSKHL